MIKIYDKETNLLKVNFNNIPCFRFNDYQFNYRKRDKCLNKQIRAFLFNKNEVSKILLQKNKSLFINLKKINEA